MAKGHAQLPSLFVPRSNINSLCRQVYVACYESAIPSSVSTSSKPPSETMDTNMTAEQKSSHLSKPPDLEEHKDINKENDGKWVSGFKLWIIMTGITLVCLLMLLDISILSTVRRSHLRIFPQRR